MSDVFYLRSIAPPITPADVNEMARHAGGCFNLHKVDWIRSFLATDGGRMLCWYRAPDTESVRVALRQLGSDMSGVWTGTVRMGISQDDLPVEAASRVAVEFVFVDALKRDALESARNRIDEALRAQGLHVELTITSTNRAHLVYVIREHDAAAVAQVMRQTDANPDSIWPCASLRLIP